MVLTRFLLTATIFLLINNHGYCSDAKFQQYTQENINPPVYFYQPISFHYPKYFRRSFFSYSSYDYFQQMNDRKYYLNNQDKNTYTSPDEYKIREN